jgi:hypothetical protein
MDSTYSPEQILSIFNKYDIILSHKSKDNKTSYYKMINDITINRDEDYVIVKLFEKYKISEHKYTSYTQLYFDDNDRVLNRDNIPKIEITDESLNSESLNSETYRRTPRFKPLYNI